MLTRADLDEAVKSGIITQQQSTALQQVPARRRVVRHSYQAGDERFVFMKNFNEFFISLGIVLLSIGLWAANLTFLSLGGAFIIIFVAIMWALAEYLTRRLKLTLPSIILGLLIVPGMAWQLHAILNMGSSWVAWADFPQNLLVPGLAASLAALLFYIRFRLPFALLLLAGSCVVAFIAVYARLFGDPSSAIIQGLLLFAGLATLAVAQWYDMSDRERLTRRADCGFWLTLIAAPLIVHPIAGMISSGGEMTAETSLITIVVVILFALAALVIDRRALLVSSLAYLGGAMVYAFTRLGGEQNALWITLLLLGASVILLGIGWHRARRAVMSIIPSTLIQYLPVVRT
jgi:hypothetical protein